MPTRFLSVAGAGTQQQRCQRSSSRAKSSFGASATGNTTIVGGGWTPEGDRVFVIVWQGQQCLPQQLV